MKMFVLILGLLSSVPSLALGAPLRVDSIVSKGSVSASSFSGPTFEIHDNETGDVSASIANTNTAAGAHATLLLSTNGGAAGDPRIQFQNGVTNWTIGLDNSVSDFFKIAGSSSLGSTDYFTLDPASGALALAGYGAGILHSDSSGHITSSSVSNSDLAGSIAYSKLVLTGAILNADLAGSIDLTSKVTGTLPAGNGGTGASTYALGDLLYSSATNTLAKLAGNTSTTLKVLTQTGTGGGSAAPVWTGTTGSGSVVEAVGPSIAAGIFTGTTTFPSSTTIDSSGFLRPGGTDFGLRSQGNERIERADIKTAGGAGTVNSQSGTWISSITRTGAGDYTLNIGAGNFTVTPACSCTSTDTTPQGCNYLRNSSSTTTARFRIWDTTFTNADGSSGNIGFSVICVGAK